MDKTKLAVHGGEKSIPTWFKGRHNYGIEEKAAVLEAASESFVSKDSPDFGLLQQWMEHKPSPRLLDAWKHYIEGLCEKLSKHQRTALRKDFIGHARQVAKTTGGLLGLGNKISKPEKEMLEKLESAFD